MTMRARTAWRRKAGAAALAFAVLGGTAACAGGGSDASGDSGGGSSGAEAPAAADGMTDGGGVDSLADAPDAYAADEGEGTSSGSGSKVADDGDTSSTVLAPRAPIDARAVISTGRVTLEAKDLIEVRDGLDRMLGKYGGFVADEQTYNDSKGRTQSSVLTLRIPSSHFDDAMRELGELGTVSDAKRKVDDVTTEVIDVDARIRTEQVSLQRLRGFLRKAQTVDAMIRLESEIARREANLSSLQAQDRYLDDQTSMSTIVLTMNEPAATPPPPPEKKALEDAGFFTGLQNGWNALLDVLLVLATVLGALLPFGIVIAVVGLPAYLWLRRHRPVAPPAPTTAEG